MDTRIKLIVNYFKISDDGRPFDFECTEHFLSGFRNSSVFEFYETDNVSIELEFDSSKSRVAYESAETGELIEVESGKEYRIHLANDQPSYFPGYFDLFVWSGDKEDRYCFCVKPRQLGLESVLYLRSYVNDFYDGMSLDLEHKRKMNMTFDGHGGLLNYFSSYNFLIMNFPMVINYVNCYVNGRHEQLIKKSVVSSSYSRVSPKSVRWLVAKGYTKNVDIRKPDYLLTEKTVFTLDCLKNRVFKSYVVFWDNELSAQLKSLLSYEHRVDENIAGLKVELAELRDELLKVSDIKAIADSVKKSMSGRAKELEGRIEALKRVKADYNNRFVTVKRFKVFMENVRFNSWISGIDEEVNFSHKRVNSKELFLIKEIGDRYLGLKRRVSYGRGGASRLFCGEEYA